MPKQIACSTPRLFSASGTYGEVDIVASDRGVLLSLTGRNYDTMGALHRGSALANLTVADARRISRLLQEAVAVSQDADPRQPGLWSEATTRAIANQPHRGPSAMNAIRISDRIARAIEDLDAAASSMTDDESADIALVASDLLDLRMDIEREQIAMVAA